MRSDTISSHLNRRYLLLVALLALGLYVLVPQIGDFRSSWHLLRRPAPGWTAAAIGLTMTTYLSAAATYCLLAFRPLKYGQTVLVQLAAMFINRLLPGGIGALGANYAYLRQRQHTATQAAGMAATNNLLGVLGNGLLVALGLAVFSGRAAVTPDYGHAASLWLKGVIIAALVLGALALTLGRHKFKRQALELRAQLNNYQRQPWRLPLALLSSMLLTLGNVFCLAACALALGLHLPIVVILLILSLGVGTGTVTPTPGGLGGFEAGLAAGFMAYGAGSPEALAIALLYRLISYWLPLVFGAAALVVCRRQQWF